MPSDIKFNKFNKGWFFKQEHLVGLDGFNDVNNFVVYQGGIETVKGWQLLILNPHPPIDSFAEGAVIDDFDNIIDTM